jgi:hypothetical protein
MYVLLDRDHDVPVKQNSVRLRLASTGSEVLGGYIQIAGFEFLIAFEVPPVRRIYRPCGLTFSRVGFPKRSWKMVAFAWPEIGHEINNVVSHVPPNVNITVPLNARAASFYNQVLPGSLNVTSGCHRYSPNRAATPRLQPARRSGPAAPASRRRSHALHRRARAFGIAVLNMASNRIRPFLEPRPKVPDSGDVEGLRSTAGSPLGRGITRTEYLVPQCNARPFTGNGAYLWGASYSVAATLGNQDGCCLSKPTFLGPG